MTNTITMTNTGAEARDVIKNVIEVDVNGTKGGKRVKRVKGGKGGKGLKKEEEV